MSHSDKPDQLYEQYRPLTAGEIEILELRGSTAHLWNDVTVKDGFDPSKVSRCRFYGQIRIGKLEDIALEAGSIALPVGLYDSTVVNSRIGDNAAVYSVSYLSGYIVGEQSLIKDVHELSVSEKPSFGTVRIEPVNENGNRAVRAFPGMWTADAHLWTKERGRPGLMKKLEELTEKEIANCFGPSPAALGVVGRSTIIHGLNIGKDLRIEDGAVVEGAARLEDLSIRSSTEEPSYIGGGTDLAHGIVGCGCSIETGAKADHFILADYASMTMGARMVHSYLGENSTVSCCEVAHSLMLPFHEQHHNSSFLIAAMVEGQSNIASGATVGSNHSSRRADGELLCRRGFWPALTVSIKHPSKFASFTLLAKEAYPYEMNIPLPFSLVSRSPDTGTLVIMPAFWFLYNRYALERNGRKFRSRDRRPSTNRPLEFSWEPVAPDTAEEILAAMTLLEEWTAGAWMDTHGTDETRNILPDDKAEPVPEGIEKLRLLGKTLLTEYPQQCGELEITRDNIERSKIPTRILKVAEGYRAYRRALHLYAVKLIAEELLEQPGVEDGGGLSRLSRLPHHEPGARGGRGDGKQTGDPESCEEWLNIGGTLFRREDKERLLDDVEKGLLSSWNDIHERYKELSKYYHKDIIDQALQILGRLEPAVSPFSYPGSSSGASSHASPGDTPGTSPDTSFGDTSNKPLSTLLSDIPGMMDAAIEEQEELLAAVKLSREKDFTDPFRAVTFSDKAEMEAVQGTSAEDSLIREIGEETERWNRLFGKIKQRHTAPRSEEQR